MDNYDTCASVFVVLFNGFMSLTSYFGCYVQILTLQKPHIPASFNMYLVISKWVIVVKVSNSSGQYLRNHWTLDIGVLGYIGIVWPKEHSPEVWPVPPVTLCIYTYFLQYRDAGREIGTALKAACHRFDSPAVDWHELRNRGILWRCAHMDRSETRTK